jgi:hypothetical protein
VLLAPPDGEEALIRFYLLHVMILPLALAILLAVHFWRIRKDGGLARPDDADARLGPPPDDAYPVFTQAPHKTYSSPPGARRYAGGRTGRRRRAAMLHRPTLKPRSC